VDSSIGNQSGHPLLKPTYVYEEHVTQPVLKRYGLVKQLGKAAWLSSLVELGKAMRLGKAAWLSSLVKLWQTTCTFVDAASTLLCVCALFRNSFKMES